ncbi:hypothetical protein AOLI_G00044560 [Acnodon oligacanthus]
MTPSPESSSQSPNLKDLLEEISKMNTTLQGVARDVTTIKSTTTELKEKVSAIQVRLKEAETRISHVEDTSDRLAGNNEKMAKRLEELWNRVDDQENRSRRNNVRIIRLKEGKEAGGSLQDYVRRILSEGFGLNGPEFEMERCHRALTPKPSDDQPPRIVLVKFLRYSALEKVLAAAKANKGLQWESCKLSVFEDMTRERAMRRKCFTAAKRSLWERGVEHTLAHPATLRFTWNGKRRSFADHVEAERYIREHVLLCASDVQVRDNVVPIPPGLEALDSSDSYMSSRNSGQEDCSVSGPDQRIYVEGSLDKKCSKTFRDFTISHHWTLSPAFIFMRSSIISGIIIIILATDPGQLETSGPMKRRSVPSSPLDIVII